MKYYLISFSISFAVTVLIELTVSFICFKVRRKKELELIFLVNLLTNPLAVVIYINLSKIFKYISIFVCIIEVSVFVTEALIYKSFSKEEEYEDIKKPWLFSLVLNALSFCTGLLLKLIIV